MLQLNMATVWVLAFVLLVIVMKVGFKVVRVLLGLEQAPFDIRKLAEFVAHDVLLDLGGLLILALPTFLVSTGLPAAFAALLAALQALFVAVALAMACKHIAKIRDYFPAAVAQDADGEDAPVIDGNPASLETAPERALTASPPAPGA